MRISDWSSDVCSSDLDVSFPMIRACLSSARPAGAQPNGDFHGGFRTHSFGHAQRRGLLHSRGLRRRRRRIARRRRDRHPGADPHPDPHPPPPPPPPPPHPPPRSDPATTTTHHITTHPLPHPA